MFRDPTKAAPLLLLLVAQAPAHAQTATDPSALVRQLADPATRVAAREQLLRIGGAAVPALTEALGDADVDFVTAALGLLHDLGPVAGSAFPRVFSLYCESCLRAPAALVTMAEIAPWRPSDSTLTWGEIAATEQRLMREPDAAHAVQWARFELRFRFPIEASTVELTQMLRSRSPWRVQLAMELLARRGASAASALPALRTVLQRPDPDLRSPTLKLSLRDHAARAVLAIAPDDELAAMARNHLAERLPPAAAHRPVPKRVRERIASLVAELAYRDTHESARANLAALGDIAAGPLGDVLATTTDAPTIDAVLAVLQQLGDRGADAVPGLLAALPVRNLEHTAAILRTIATTAPRSELRLEDLRFELELQQRAPSWNDRPIPGLADWPELCVIATAAAQLRAALEVDPGAPSSELREQLRSSDVFVRERALAVITDRGQAAADLLPDVGELLLQSHPAAHSIKRPGIHSSYFTEVRRTPFVLYAAAEAVIVLAPPTDRLVPLARRTLAEPPPK